jgi:putative toxin-antitoxin system antitoxin component (TIGR02293 family)
MMVTTHTSGEARTSSDQETIFGDLPAQNPIAPREAKPDVWAGLHLQDDAKGLSAHDLVTGGIPVVDAKQMMGAFSIIKESQFYSVLGISPKTMQRRSNSAHQTLDVNASDRALRLASVVHQAIDVLGSLEAAERWLDSPATALDRRKPIDLLQSTEGTHMVKTLLTRMGFGVYT